MSPIPRFQSRENALVPGAARGVLVGEPGGVPNKAERFERAQQWLSPVNLHLAGLALLVLVNIYLLIHLAIAWSGAYRDNADALEQQTIELKGAEIAAQPLRGLGVKLARADAEAEKFYQQRIPTEISTVLSELGFLTKKNGVKLTGVQYSAGPAANSANASQNEVQAADAGLTEVRMDARLSGDYRPLVQFINGLERDKVFFLVDSVALTGQQTGVVNLRIKMSAYLRQPNAADQQANHSKAVSLDSNGDLRGISQEDLVNSSRSPSGVASGAPGGGVRP